MNIDIAYIITVIVVILISMTLHEAMHAYAGYWLGDDTARLSGRLSLNPIKHIDPFMTILLPLFLAVSGAPVFGGAKPVPFNPNNIRGGEWGLALVALAGPVTNFLLSYVIFGIWVIAGAPDSGIWAQILITAVSVNIGFFIFNMIPIPPLDGSRVLYALAPDFARRIMEQIESFGVVIVFAFVLFAGSTFGVFMLSIINFFMTLFARMYGL